MFKKKDKSASSDASLQQVLDELQEVKAQQKEILDLLKGLALGGGGAKAASASAPAAAAPAKPLSLPGASAGDVSASGLPKFFVSYCWLNSRDAEQLKEVPKAVGVADPREIQRVLAGAGLKGWLDKEQLGDKGLFEDIADGLLGSRAVVAFISDEYANSDNCNMEFQYARKTLKLPVIAVIVGQGWAWQRSKLGLLLAGELYIDMTKPELIESKLEELRTRVNMLVGASATEESYRAATSQNKAITYEVGTQVERRCDAVAESACLNFDSHFAKTKYNDASAGNVLACVYWWPVEIIEVDASRPGKVKIHYLGYGADWDTWVSHSDLRPTHFPTLNLDSLKEGTKVEVRLGQRGGAGYDYAYAWCAGTVLNTNDGGRIRVKIDTQLGPSSSNTYFDEALVNAGSVRIL